MKTLTLFYVGLFFTILSGSAHASCPSKVKLPIHLKTYGHCQHQAIIYLHGGPGDHTQVFTHTTAKAIAQKGFFVVTYDRRGTGHSSRQTKPTDFTFKRAIEDLHQIITQLKLKSGVILLGHSFGGVLGLKYLESYPDTHAKLILVSAPLDYPKLFKQLLDRFLKMYPAFIQRATQQKRHNMASAMKRAMGTCQMLRTFMFPKKGPLSPLWYSTRQIGFIFSLAMQFGLYTPKNISKVAKARYAKLSKKGHIRMAYKPFAGFIRNEQYAMKDYTPLAQTLKQHIYGVYGQQDGLFNKTRLAHIQRVLGKQMTILQRAGHAPFVDRQQAFVQALKRISSNPTSKPTSQPSSQPSSNP